jgi:hypothetical protein
MKKNILKAILLFGCIAANLILAAEDLVKPQEKTIKTTEPVAAAEAVATMQLTVGEKTVFQSEREKNQYKRFKLVLDENIVSPTDAIIVTNIITNISQKPFFFI